MKRYFLTITVLALIFWAIWAAILYKLPPTTADGKIVTKTVGFFLGALGLALTFSSSPFFYVVHRIFGRIEPSRTALRKSLREGFLAGLCVVGLALLKLIGVLTMLNLGLLIATFVTLEIYFLTRRQEKNSVD